LGSWPLPPCRADWRRWRPAGDAEWQASCLLADGQTPVVPRLRRVSRTVFINSTTAAGQRRRTPI